MTEELAQRSMEIIMHAGDARTVCMKALDAIKEADFENARKYMAEATSEINKAHGVHTEFLQNSMENEEDEYTILFAHAQDTLMTIISEINVTNKMIEIFEAYDSRMKKIEEGK